MLVGIGEHLLPQRLEFSEPVPWANFDGEHYLTIAASGYHEYEQAFFPGYPLVMRFVAQNFLADNYILAGLLISNTSFLLSLFVVARMLSVVLKKMEEESLRWTLAFMVFFPTSFFYASLYSESLFLLLLVTSFYFLSQKRLFFYGVVAGIASSVRLVGSFLMVPFGLAAYMFFLGKEYNDPLLFIHVQSAFGAERSNGDFILLPQVYFRYLKIFTTVGKMEYSYWIAMLEFVLFNSALYLLWKAWKDSAIPREWVYFSLAALIIPSLTGSLSSMPRYILVCLPVYIVLSRLPSTIRNVTFALSCLLLGVLTILFTRGYWVS